MTLAERAVLRIREEMTERKISQRDLAGLLRCSQGRVAKMLNGGVRLRLNDVAVLAEAVGISVVEAVRDRGLEFHAELTPSELRLLERLRRRPQALQGVLMVLGLPDDSKSKADEAKRHTRRLKRP
jgi:transcriptional regulator with XRE-family HTH domain